MKKLFHITVSTIAIEGEIYPIYRDSFKIGDAEFLKRDGDKFIFDVKLSEKEANRYEYKFDIEASTHKLLLIRVC